ncbi:MAG: fimbrial protein [Pseudomonadota bacterium]
MSPTRDDDETEEPLDPAMERVRRKLIWLLAISGGVMAVGFLTVIVAVMYRVSQVSVEETVAEVTLDVPASAVLSATVADGHLILTIGGDNPRIEVRNQSDGALLQTFRLQGGAQAPAQ